MYDILVLLLVAVNAADVYTTYRALSSDVGITEANPIVNKAVEEFGLQWGLVLPKMVFFACWFGFAVESAVWSAVAIVLIAVYSKVVYRNYQILRNNGVSL